MRKCRLLWNRYWGVCSHVGRAVIDMFWCHMGTNIYSLRNRLKCWNWVKVTVNESIWIYKRLNKKQKLDFFLENWPSLKLLFTAWKFCSQMIPANLLSDDSAKFAILNTCPKSILYYKAIFQVFQTIILF